MGMKARANVATFFKYFVLILMGFIMVYPLLWMVGSTFKTNAEIFTSLSPFTAHPTLDGYYNAVTKTYGGDITIWRAIQYDARTDFPLFAHTVGQLLPTGYHLDRSCQNFTVVSLQNNLFHLNRFESEAVFPQSQLHSGEHIFEIECHFSQISPVPAEHRHAPAPLLIILRHTDRKKKTPVLL